MNLQKRIFAEDSWNHLSGSFLGTWLFYWAFWWAKIHRFWCAALFCFIVGLIVEAYQSWMYGEKYDKIDCLKDIALDIIGIAIAWVAIR